MTEATRCAVVAILGAPNAGKSTLINALVGRKVSIVTHKVQTTRFPLRGVAIKGAAQLVLIDTPGIFAPKRRLDRAMVRSAWAALDGADAIAHVVDAASAWRVQSRAADSADARAEEDVARILERLKTAGLPALLVLNKIDQMPREGLLETTKRLFDTGAYAQVFMLSALTGDGVADLAASLADNAPLGPWLFPEDEIADAPARLMAAEITREKLMLRLHDELPYETTVETETWQERKDGSVRIDQIISVQRDSQRKIAIGEKGQTVKAIGLAARHDMERLFDRKVHLFLHVKLRENWSEERGLYQSLGLDWDA